jgi:hypothetical protein
MNPYTALATQIIKEEPSTQLAKFNRGAAPDSLRVPSISKARIKSQGQKSIIRKKATPKSFSGATAANAVKKATYLGILGMSFMAVRFIVEKFDKLIKVSRSSELNDVKEFLPPIKKILVPATVFTAIPLTLSLLSKDNYKTLSIFCYLFAAAYSAKEIGPLIYKKITKNVKEKEPAKTEKQKIGERMNKKLEYLKHLE